MNVTLRLKGTPTLRLRYQPGLVGPAGTITVGTVTTGSPGSSVIVTNSGTSQAATLNFTIPRGDTGATGDDGWSPILAIVSDGLRRVVQIADWTGGEGTKPATGSYIGPTGLVTPIGDAVDIRGEVGPSGSVTDGDKGDITVSTSGTVWTVDNAAISNAKLANVSTATFKGRASSGSGAPEDLTVAQASSLLGMGLEQPGGRLTLVTGVPAPAGDTTGATTVYYTYAISNVIPVYDGTSDVRRVFTSDLALPLTSDSSKSGYHQVGKQFDVFAAMSGGALVLGTGPAWTGDNARGSGSGTTELTLLAGLYRNAQSIQLRINNSGTGADLVTISAQQATYLGTFRAMADGQARDTLLFRWLSNAFNQVPRAMRVADATGSWAYTTAAWRQANNNTANQVTVVIGLPGSIVDLTAYHAMSGTAGVTGNCFVGIGLDTVAGSSATEPSTSFMQTGVTNIVIPGLAQYRADPGIGYHYLAWTEYGSASATLYGSSANCGMTGTVTA